MIEDIDRDAGSRAQLLAALVKMAGELGIRCIAEGIERQAEAEACAGLGFELGSGLPVRRPGAGSRAGRRRGLVMRRPRGPGLLGRLALALALVGLLPVGFAVRSLIGINQTALIEQAESLHLVAARTTAQQIVAVSRQPPGAGDLAGQRPGPGRPALGRGAAGAGPQPDAPGRAWASRGWWW